MLWLMERAGKKNSNNKSFQFWQQDNHPIELWDNYMLDQKLEYIHNNPVVAGFVRRPEDYLYSSARDYAGEKGLLDIELAEYDHHTSTAALMLARDEGFLENDYFSRKPAPVQNKK